MIVTLPVPPSANRYWRVFRGRAVVSQEARQYKGFAGLFYRNAGGTLHDGPVCLTMTVYRARKAGDLDNFEKVLLDALRGLAYIDDAQVVEIHAYRRDDKDNPRVEVEIQPA
jgi:crossover junction endodeoxyribonuclease RusA